MEGQEIKFNNAVIRIHFSDRTKEERNETVKNAAEKYMKHVLFSKKGCVANEKCNSKNK